jgi:hypothetical protein
MLASFSLRSSLIVNVTMPAIVKVTTNQVNTTASANMDSTLFGHDSDWWSGAMLLSLLLAFVVAGLVAAATAGVIVVQKREAIAAKAELERYKSAADGKIADARREGIDAGKKATDAELKAAQANERAAGLEKEAALAQLETEKIKAVVAWRTLEPKAAASLESALAAHPGSVNLRWTDGDPEAMFLAIQFDQLLNKAHWKVAAGASKLGGMLPFGIHVPQESSTDGKVLRAALSAAQIPFTAVPWPPSTGGLEFNTSRIDGAPELYIGSRHPPSLQ